MHIKDYCIIYRTIGDMQGEKRGSNQFLSCSVLLKADYAILLNTFLPHRKALETGQSAA